MSFDSKEFISSMRGIQVPGLHAYADEISVEAGEKIRFHVSSTVPYEFSVRRLGSDPDDALTDEVIVIGSDHFPCPQPIYPGSWIVVEKGLPAELPEFSVECWVRPWKSNAKQTIISQSEFPAEPGFSLDIDPMGKVQFCCGGGSAGQVAIVSSECSLVDGWNHLVATFLRGDIRLYLNGSIVANGEGPPVCKAAAAPIRLGAIGIGGKVEQFLDADICMPCIYSTALVSEEVVSRFKDGARSSPSPSDLLACWPLTENSGTTVHDISRGARVGHIINHATWMIPGPLFDNGKVPRFSSEPAYFPLQDKDRGSALRFASDDLVDCAWNPMHTVTIPLNAKSDLYVGRFDFCLNGKDMTYECTFVVRKRRDQACAPIAVLCSTNTWLAYASSPFADNIPAAGLWPRGSVGLPSSCPGAPNHNSYRPHRYGQPSYYTGLRVPRPNTSPRALYEPRDAGYGQWVRLERELHVWLDANQYEFDMFADLDLHKNPSLLSNFQTVIINGHSEYWSEPALDGLEKYLAGGGTAIVLSGNSMFWRVSFDDECLVMEQRKTQTPMSQAEAPAGRHSSGGGAHGEQYHSQDAARGGLWRFNGRSCADLIGLETAGWAFAEAKDFGVYKVAEPTHFLFSTPFETGLAKDSTFGHGPGGSLPRAVGHEWDLTIATILRRTGAPPSEASLPNPQQNIVVLAEGVRFEKGQMDAYVDWFERSTDAPGGVSAEMIYWERPQGGRVFNAGSIAASWVLRVDGAFSSLIKNVLFSFGVPSPVN